MTSTSTIDRRGSRPRFCEGYGSEPGPACSISRTQRSRAINSESSSTGSEISSECGLGLGIQASLIGTVQVLEDLVAMLRDQLLRCDIEKIAIARRRQAQACRDLGNPVR